MQLRRVDPRKIKVPEVRVTSQFDEETEAEFKKAVKEWGIETPPLCFEVDGELVLVDGKHRLDEALSSGAASIDVVIRSGDMVQVLTRNIYLDHLRGKHRPSEMIKVLKSLSQDYGLDTDQIADQTYKNRDYVERLLKISQGIPAVLEALDRGDIGVGVAEQIVRLPNPVQQEELLAQLGKYKLTVPEVTAFVNDTLKYMEQAKTEAPVQQPPPAPMPTVFKCEACHKEVDKRFLALVTLCPECFSNVWRLAKASEEKQVPVAEEPEGA